MLLASPRAWCHRPGPGSTPGCSTKPPAPHAHAARSWPAFPRPFPPAPWHQGSGLGAVAAPSWPPKTHPKPPSPGRAVHTHTVALRHAAGLGGDGDHKGQGDAGWDPRTGTEITHFSLLLQCPRKLWCEAAQPRAWAEFPSAAVQYQCLLKADPVGFWGRGSAWLCAAGDFPPPPSPRMAAPAPLGSLMLHQPLAAFVRLCHFFMYLF